MNQMDRLMRMMGAPGRRFQVQLRCFSAPFMPNINDEKLKSVNFGGKIILPSSALDMLTRMQIEYPMYFKLTNISGVQRATHVGVLEFSAEEGKCYVAAWMMTQLGLQEGEIVSVEYIQLPRAEYAKFKPKSKEFLEVSNPKAVLEVELRKFACLTKGDNIAVKYNDLTLEFGITETRPGNAVSIMECDVLLDFEPIDGVEDQRDNAAAGTTQENAPGSTATMSAGTHVTVKGGAASDPFKGQGMRVDGKPTKPSAQQQPKQQPQSQRDGVAKSGGAAANGQIGAASDSDRLVVNIDYKPGQLTFPRDYTNLEALKKKQQQQEDGPRD